MGLELSHLLCFFEVSSGSLGKGILSFKPFVGHSGGQIF